MMNMIIALIVLLITPLLGGGLFRLLPLSRRNFRLALVFSGSYLFAITLVDVLPHLFLRFGNVSLLGFGVLAGFFLQQVLEYF